jgi:predicted acetyltransferase
MMSVEVRVSPASEQELPVLRHLMSLYVYDFSELMGLDVEEDGAFKLPELAAYWRDPWRHPFLIRVDGKLVGFALVHGRSRLTGADGIHDMAEFFVLRKYRRQGVGEQAARDIFARFPGPWEVRERPSNVNAIAFWRGVIDRLTGGQFREVNWADDAWQGPVQLFAT